MDKPSLTGWLAAHPIKCAPCVAQACGLCTHQLAWEQSLLVAHRVTPKSPGDAAGVGDEADTSDDEGEVVDLDGERLWKPLECIGMRKGKQGGVRVAVGWRGGGGMVAIGWRWGWQ